MVVSNVSQKLWGVVHIILTLSSFADHRVDDWNCHFRSYKSKFDAIEGGPLNMFYSADQQGGRSRHAS